MAVQDALDQARGIVPSITALADAIKQSAPCLLRQQINSNVFIMTPIFFTLRDHLNRLPHRMADC